MSNFTPADALREHAARLETQAAELRQLAETIDNGQISARSWNTPQTRRRDVLDSSTAEKFAKCSRATLARAARRDPQLGWQTPGGSWRFSKSRLIEMFLQPRAENGELVEFVEAPPLSPGADIDQCFQQQRGKNARSEFDPP